MQVEDILRRHVFDGVEIWHSAASEAQMDKLIEMVDRLNSTISRDKPLIVTIGSDTHGKFDKRFGFNTSSRTHTGLQALEGSFRSMEILSRSARDRYIADFLLHWGMSDKSHRRDRKSVV